jgi:hypothetical protein
VRAELDTAGAGLVGEAAGAQDGPGQGARHECLLGGVLGGVVVLPPAGVVALGAAALRAVGGDEDDAAPAECLRGPEDPDGGVAVDSFQGRHRGVEADACCEEHGLAAVDRGGELLLGGGLQVQPDRADAGAVQGCGGALAAGQPADLVAGVGELPADVDADASAGPDD